jgi:hypothetical protein
MPCLVPASIVLSLHNNHIWFILAYVDFSFQDQTIEVIWTCWIASTQWTSLNSRVIDWCSRHVWYIYCMTLRNLKRKIM